MVMHPGGRLFTCRFGLFVLQDLDHRKMARNHTDDRWPEWVWQGSASLGDTATVFAGELGGGGYGAPINFNSQTFDKMGQVCLFCLASWMPTRICWPAVWIELVCGSRFSRNCEQDVRALCTYFPPRSHSSCYSEPPKIEKVQDDPRRHDYNVDAYIDKVVQAAQDQAFYTKTEHQMWPCGSDFNYDNADRWFHNMDK
jgi:hypothetical protein